jgi:hypothetical protein
MSDGRGPLNLAPPTERETDVITIRRFLPAIACTPRRAAISTALIAGIAAGPLAGHASGRTATPTANPVVAAMTGATSPAPEAPAVEPGNAPTSTGTGKRVAAGKPASPAPANSAAPAAAPPPPPPYSELLPNGTPTDQSHIDTDGDQNNNIRAIVKASKEMNLPPRAAVIAVATSLQETKLRNYGDLGGMNDHDSLGLFQQRPSSGWGTPDQLTNPDYSTKAFLSALVQVPDWQTMPLTDAAQDVQVSAFGDRYAQWEQEAADIVHDYYNIS